MKVLHVINCLTRGGGAEKFVLDLILELKRKGVEVEILSILPPPVDKQDFRILLEQSGITVHILTKRNLYSWKNIFYLQSFLKTHTYDLVHGHLFPVLYFCAIACGKKMKLVYTEHSTDNRRRHILLFKIIDKLVYRRYHKIVCISQKVQELLQRHAGRIDTTIIPNGITISIFQNATPLLLPEQDKKLRWITMSARLVKGKDYTTVFKALRLLDDNVHLLCVGTGPLLEEHRKYCENNNLFHRVHFLGLRNDIPQILKASDVIILSSEHEGFSLSMLEAMASGNPFIASDVPGISDLIKDYTDLFPFGQEKVLAEYISRLLTDKKYRNEIVEKNLRFASQYDISNISEEYLSLYNRLLDC